MPRETSNYLERDRYLLARGGGKEQSTCVVKRQVGLSWRPLETVNGFILRSNPFYSRGSWEEKEVTPVRRVKDFKKTR